MSWTQVSANLVFESGAYSANEEASIRSLLSAMYAGSQTARDALEGAAGTTFLYFGLSAPPTLQSMTPWIGLASTCP